MSYAPYRQLVAGLAAMGPVTLRGQEYRGEYLSTMLAINPEHPADEASRTSQLISEFGRLAAAALHDKEIAEVQYRIWRERVIFEVTTDLAAARAMGAVPDDATKLPSKTAAESFIHTLPEYLEHKKAVARAEEVWATLHAAFEAAKARQYSIRAFEATGAAPRAERPDPSAEADSTVHYHAGFGDQPPRTERIADMEARYAEMAPPSPLPRPVGAAPPPPPPVAPPRPPVPPPPPTRS